MSVFEVWKRVWYRNQIIWSPETILFSIDGFVAIALRMEKLTRPISDNRDCIVGKVCLHWLSIAQNLVRIYVPNLYLLMKSISVEFYSERRPEPHLQSYCPGLAWRSNEHELLCIAAVKAVSATKEARSSANMVCHVWAATDVSLPGWSSRPCWLTKKLFDEIKGMRFGRVLFTGCRFSEYRFKTFLVYMPMALSLLVGHHCCAMLVLLWSVHQSSALCKRSL